MKGAPRMVSMLLGCIVSFVGVALVLGLTVYYITLPMGAPMRQFFDTTIFGLPYLLYFAIIGSVITAAGLLIFIKASRTGEEIVRTRRTAIRPPRRAERIRATRLRPAAGAESGQGGIVEEIEREIEEIVRSGEEEVIGEAEAEAEEIEEEEKPTIEVITQGSEMVCPHCGAINPLGSKKCSKCGKLIFRVKKGEPTCPVCGAPLRLAKKLTDELFVCGICFSELNIPQELQAELKLT